MVWRGIIPTNSTLCENVECQSEGEIETVTHLVVRRHSGAGSSWRQVTSCDGGPTGLGVGGQRWEGTHSEVVEGETALLAFWSTWGLWRRNETLRT